MAQRKTVQERLEAAKITINRRYSMVFQEAVDIAKEDTGIIEKVFTAFKYGYLQGSKATKKEYEAAKASQQK